MYALTEEQTLLRTIIFSCCPMETEAEKELDNVRAWSSQRIVTIPLLRKTPVNEICF
ncbi:hypothetical protein DPMN_035110 [Dreissena polymorpha]|uniref:Uncharacterized protein n=1 Tax=Dreissena polymorpha TaxID=45954 RepID=A0A9D4M6X2_DREPO|nr:hypothetical protein DPMN_035110 [Dreissena polymorpha]